MPSFATSRVRMVTIACVAALAACLGAGTAQAATFTVSTTADQADGSCPLVDCSVREALAAAEAAPGADTVSIPAGDYTISGGALAYDNTSNGALAITGAGAGSTILRGGGTGILEIFYSNNDVTLHGLGFTGGTANVPNSWGSGGGGLATNGNGTGTLTLDALRFTDNHTQQSGGALQSLGRGTVRVRDVEVSGSSARFGGGGAMFAGQGTLDVQRMSVHDNTSGAYGGGLQLQMSGTIADSVVDSNTTVSDGGGMEIWGAAVDFRNVTISRNVVTSATGLGGGMTLIGTTPSSATLANSLLVGNRVDANASNCEIRPGDATLTSLGHNHMDTPAGCVMLMAAADDWNGATVGALQAQGGNGHLVTALDYTSAERDAGDPAYCTGRSGDARNVPRTIGPVCDIGAVEFGGVTTDVAASIDPLPPTVALGSPLQVTGRITNAGPEVAWGATVVFDVPPTFTAGSAQAPYGGECTARSATQVACTTGWLELGGPLSTVAQVYLWPTATGPATIGVSVEAPGFATDANPANQSASAVVSIVDTPANPGPPADLNPGAAPDVPATASSPQKGALLPVTRGSFTFRAACPAGVPGGYCDMRTTIASTKKLLVGKRKSIVTASCVRAFVPAGTTKAIKCALPKKALKPLARKTFPAKFTIRSTPTEGGPTRTTTGTMRLRVR